MASTTHTYGPQSAVGSKNISSTERALSLLSGGAALAYGLWRRNIGGAALALSGGYLLYRGISGHSPIYEALGLQAADDGVQVQKTFTVNRPVDEVYQFWRNFENLPQFMQHLERVHVLDERRSHWVAKAPTGSVEWDAEITNDQPNQRIAWRSTDDAQISNQGEVRFRPAPGEGGTEVRVALSYQPPAGVAGALVAKLLGEEPTWQVTEDLRRFKSLMEAGEIPTIEGQPHG